MTQFHQIDVFSARVGDGNPLAVVHDADELPADAMADFARWTNLSETTFLLRPSVAGADYRVRIFTTVGELPFAGHPTLGSARAWIEAGGMPVGNEIMQECGIGLVSIRRDGTRYAFDAPPLRRSGPVDASLRDRVIAALRMAGTDVRAVEWIDNGPGWIGVLASDADAVLRISPDFGDDAHLEVGVMGPHAAGGPADFEARAFVPGDGVWEDPVTGSLAAGFARWLIPAGLAPDTYSVRQGTCLQRNGRIDVRREGERIWVGGDTVVGVEGTVALG